MRDVSVNRFAVVSYAVSFGFGGIERDSHSPIATTSTIYGFQKREDCYEEGSFRGAFHSGANFRYPLVDMKRRARECSAFFYARRPIRGNSKGLWRFVGVATPRHSTLWFETKHRVPCRNATFRHGTPFQTHQNSLTLWFTGVRWLTGRFAKGGPFRTTLEPRAYVTSISVPHIGFAAQRSAVKRMSLRALPFTGGAPCPLAIPTR